MDGIFFWQDGWIPKEGLKEPSKWWLSGKSLGSRGLLPLWS